MAIRGIGLGNDGSTNTAQSAVTYTIPAGVQAGDIIKVSTSCNTSTLTASIANTGTGIAWSVDSGPDDNSGNNRTYVFTGIALSDSASQTVTVTWSSTGRIVGILVAVSGDTPVTMSITMGPPVTTASTAVTFPAVSAPANADIVLIGIFRVGAVTPVTMTAPTGYTKDGESKSGYTTSANYTHTALHLTTPPSTSGTVTPPAGSVSAAATQNLYTLVLPKAIQKLKIGTANPAKMALGVNQLTAIYLGTAQVWP